MTVLIHQYNQRQQEYYEKQIDELEVENKLFEQLYHHHRKRAESWKKRFEALLESVENVGVSDGV